LIGPGEITVASLRQDAETRAWFPTGYDLFSFDDAESYRGILGARTDQLQVLAFIGTWCPDCQEHLPGFVRIWETAKFPPGSLRIYALDRAKSFPGGEELIQKHAIRRLPTFVFLRGGKELGRITETPKRTLLADMARIVLD
jgi:thiol-disulfide isomerase/thioredoxin